MTLRPFKKQTCHFRSNYIPKLSCCFTKCNKHAIRMRSRLCPRMWLWMSVVGIIWLQFFYYVFLASAPPIFPDLCESFLFFHTLSRVSMVFLETVNHFAWFFYVTQRSFILRSRPSILCVLNQMLLGIFIVDKVATEISALFN